METIAKKSRLWFPAWMAASRYVLLHTMNALSIWLLAVEGTWNQLTSWHYWVLGTQLTIAALGALGAVMNGSWNKAKEQDSRTP